MGREEVGWREVRERKSKSRIKKGYGRYRNKKIVNKNGKSIRRRVNRWIEVETSRKRKRREIRIGDRRWGYTINRRREEVVRRIGE